MDPRDTTFLYVERPDAKQHNMTAYVFGDAGASPNRAEIQNRAEILAWFEARAGGLDLLRRRLVRVPLDLDHPYWIDDPDFAVGNHVVFHRAADWVALRALMADILQADMDLERPPWQLHVVTGVRGVPGLGGAPGADGTATVVAVKTHHCAADGVLQVQVARRLFGAEIDEAECTRVGVGEQVPSRAGLTARGLAATPRVVGRLSGRLWDAYAGQRRLRAEYARGALVPPVPQFPRTSFNRALGPRRAFNAAAFRLGEVRDVKARIGAQRHGCGVTVNDVMLTTIGGAMRRYLAEAGEEPAASLGAGVPNSIRRTHDGDSRNQFVTMTVDLHTEIDDPIERAVAVHDSVSSEKARKTSPAAVRTDRIGGALPGYAFRGVMRLLRALPSGDATTIGGGNTLVSNVPKGDADLALCGRPVRTVFGLCPLVGSSGLAHHVDSIGDVLTVNITVDPDQFADDERYVDLLRTSFDELAAVAGAPR